MGGVLGGEAAEGGGEVERVHSPSSPSSPTPPLPTAIPNHGSHPHSQCFTGMAYFVR